MTNKQILIICYSDHSREPRLIMQCNALSAMYKVTTAGYAPLNNSNVQFIRLQGEKDKAPFTFHLGMGKLMRAPFSLLNKLYYKINGNSSEFQKKDYRLLVKRRFDLIICHHPGTLELAFKLKGAYHCPVIFNAHEIYPFEFEENKEWMEKNFAPSDALLKKYFKICDAVFTVNREIGDFYANRYGGKCVPALNSKPYNSIEPSQVSSPIRIIHHGGAMPRRKLENMAEAVLKAGPRFELTFMLVNNANNNYLEELKSLYEPKGIRFMDAVPFSQIIPVINRFDLGIHILPNENINQKLALPNKLFEFMQAKLGVVSGPNPAMKAIIDECGIGKTTLGDDVDSIAEVLSSLSLEEIQTFKNNTREAAKRYSSDQDEERIRLTVDSLLA